MPKRRKPRRADGARGENAASAGAMPEAVEGTRGIDILLLPADASSPLTLRVPCVVRDDGEYAGEESHTINWKPLLGVNAAFTSQPVGPVETRPGTASTPYTASRLYLAFNDCFAIDGSPINRCAEQLTGWRSPTKWRGNMVGYRAREPADRLTQFMDVSMSDLADFVRFLKDHGSPPAFDPARSAEPVQSKNGEDVAPMLETATPQADEDDVGIEEPMCPPRPPPVYAREYASGRQKAAPLGVQAEPLRQSRFNATTEEDLRRMIREQVRQELLQIAVLFGGGYMALRFLLFPAIAALYRVWGVKTLLSFLWIVCKGLLYGVLGLPVVLICIPLVFLIIMFVFVVIAFCSVAAGLLISL